MVNIQDLKVIGSGATADVYLYDNDTIIKLFRENYSSDSVSYEATIAKEINKTGIRAPAFYETIQINNRHGIVYEFVSGELLVSLLLSSSLSQGVALIKKLVRTQIDINKNVSHDITSQVERLSYLINRANNIDQYKNKLIDGLNSIKHDSYICHGDLHAGNVIVKNSEFVAIDWMNCYAGNKEGDLVRSYLMLISPYVPFPLGLTKKLVLQVYKVILAKVYLYEYLRVSGIKKIDLRKWFPLIAAARLADNVPGEERWLIRLIGKNMKYLPTVSA